MIYGLPHTEVVPGTVTNTGCRLRTYVYEAKQTSQYVPGVCYESYYVGYRPVSPSNVQMAGTVLGTVPFLKNADGNAKQPLAASQAPEIFFIEQNYPNPFNPETSICFSLSEEAAVQLVIFDLGGRQMCKLIDRAMAAGHHKAAWNGRDDTGSEVPSGVYYYQITAGNFRDRKKMAIVR